jgi:hypothetical protein
MSTTITTKKNQETSKSQGLQTISSSKTQSYTFLKAAVEK